MSDPIKDQAELISAVAKSIDGSCWVSDIEQRLQIIAEAMRKISIELDKRRGGER